MVREPTTVDGTTEGGQTSSEAPSLEAAARGRTLWRRFFQLSPIAMLYILGLVLPYLYLLRMSFNKYDAMFVFREAFALDNYAKLLSDTFYLQIVGETIWLGLAVTFFTLIVGYPIAWQIARCGPRMKSFLLAAVLSPLLINLVVRTYGWLALLGDNGIINGWLLDWGLVGTPLPLSNNFWTVVVGLGHVTLPFMVLSLVSVMESLSSQVIEAAESLGASVLRIFTDVVWPLTWAGVGAGSILVFCFSISAFVTPALLGGGHVSTVSTLIYEQFTFSVNWPLGSALVFVLLAMNMIVILLHARLFRQEV
ncbi:MULTISPECIES: ABC transporter permease [Limibacillus]|jgi:putative spermidine/putrescine transport system permease protein|uniref:Putative spermidine/putrescine transport system permease protein n=1 Tax=Limibacillus halophilus TaxID=1579333 RepID=A0A839SWT2_9PROT|nr:ABC transporter permease [Limibacillus halophilus]MBB3066124.1 putative spermidine/putrescine transport system permease protein [Limibacillus halophilus]